MDGGTCYYMRPGNSPAEKSGPERMLERLEKGSRVLSAKTDITGSAGNDGDGGGIINSAPTALYLYFRHHSALQLVSEPI